MTNKKEGLEYAYRKKKDLLSIIVPVYNVENTLERCVNSICNQGYDDIEIILVNDGSEDNSLRICYKLSKIDRRIRVISQKNSGVSAARNLGIEVATGLYIGFVDSDDWIDLDMYSSMYKFIQENNTELVLCNYTQVYGEKYVKRDEFIGIKGNEGQIKEELLSKILCSGENNMLGSCCRMLISSELLYMNNIKFDIRIRMSEDMMFAIKCIDAASRISLDRKHLYYYWINQNSVTAKYMINIWDDMMVLIEWCNKNILIKYPNLRLGNVSKEYITNAVTVAITNACKNETPMSIRERIKYSNNLCQQLFVKDAIQLTWKHKKRFRKKVWPQVVCVAMKCNWIVVLFHSLKHRTIFTKS